MWVLKLFSIHPHVDVQLAQAKQLWMYCWAPGKDQQAFDKHRPVYWRCRCFQMPAPGLCWLLLPPWQNGQKNMRVSVRACALQHLSDSCLGRFVPGLELLVWTSSFPPASSAMGTVNSNREREKPLVWVRVAAEFSLLGEHESEPQHNKDCFLQNSLVSCDNEKQMKSKESQT